LPIANFRLLWTLRQRFQIGNWQLAIKNEMTPKEIAAHYDAKVFDTPEAAKVAKALGIKKVGLMTPDIRGDSAGAMVSVVVGQDKANLGA